RLSVFQIKLPALNERLEDVEALASFFVRMYATKMNKPVPEITGEFLRVLKMHPWKGNIRELKNVIERALILCDRLLIPDHLPFDFNSVDTSSSLFDLAEVEKMH